jgi:hypothetical protein
MLNFIPMDGKQYLKNNKKLKSKWTRKELKLKEIKHKENSKKKAR